MRTHCPRCGGVLPGQVTTIAGVHPCTCKWAIQPSIEPHPNEAEYAALRRKAEQEAEDARLANLWTAVERQQRAAEELGDLTRRCIALLEGVMAQQADIGRRLARLEQGIDTVDTSERD